MALDNLLAVLLREAEAEAEAILVAARAEAEAIRARGTADLAERRRRLDQELEADRHTAVEFALAAARREARRDELLARERMIERVLAAARTRFPDALVRPEFRAALPAQIREGVECLAGRPGTLRYHPDLVQEVTCVVAEMKGIELIPDPAAGAGFRLASADGALEIDGTLADRLERLDRPIRQEVLRRLEQGL
jgi:vacuolar-type H+-ATPase subunit E/Vma4